MAAARVLDPRCLLVALLGGDAGLRGGERRGALTDGGPAWTVADEQINPWTLVAGTDGLLNWASKGELLHAGRDPPRLSCGGCLRAWARFNLTVVAARSTGMTKALRREAEAAAATLAGFPARSHEQRAIAGWLGRAPQRTQRDEDRGRGAAGAVHRRRRWRAPRARSIAADEHPVGAGEPGHDVLA